MHVNVTVRTRIRHTDRHTDGHTDGQTDVAILICTLWGHKNHKTCNKNQIFEN